MKKFIQRICDSIKERWNRLPSKRKNIIVFALLALYAAITFFMFFSPTPDYGYEEHLSIELPSVELTEESEDVTIDSISADKVREMEKFFNQLNFSDNE